MHRSGRSSAASMEVAAHSIVVLLAQPTGEADWQAVWMAGAHQGPRLLTALPPDPARWCRASRRTQTLITERSKAEQRPATPSNR